MSMFHSIPFLSVAALAAAMVIRRLRRLESERSRIETAAGRYRAILEALAADPGSESRIASAKEALAGLRSHCDTDLDDVLLARLEKELEGPRSGAEHPAGEAADFIDSRYLFVSFEEEIRRAKLGNRPLTLLDFELENLPEIRDAFGFPVVDRLLRRVAHAVRGQMRRCDTFIRSTPDEFILVLPGVSRAEALRVEDRLRSALQGVSLTVLAGRALRARISLGSATWPDDGRDFDRLLATADGRRLADRTGRREPGSERRGPAHPGLPHRLVSHN